MTPHDSYDFDATQQIITADLTIEGRRRHVAMQANKNGFFYVLDAATGELLSAKPFIPGTNWASSVDLKTGKPNINPEARYDKTGKGFILIPQPFGGHSWHPMSFDPQTGLVYIPAMAGNYGMVAMHGDDNPMGQKLSISLTKGFALFNQPGARRLDEGYLLAWDPVNQKEAWRVSFGAGRSGGTLTTAGGLVFQGNTQHEELAAYRADDGQRLWAMAVNTGIVAGPITYRIDGEQYVAVVSGSRLQGSYYGPNYSRILVFKLGGSAQLPPPVAPPEQVLNSTPEFGTAALRARGEDRYGRFCGTCHGIDGSSRGLFPDLRYSAALGSRAVFASIVLGGALKENGMVSFSTALSPEDAEAVRAYLVGRAHYAAVHGPGGFAPK